MERCGPGTGRNPKRTPGKRQAAGGRLARESRAAAELHRTYKHCSLLASKHLLVLYDPPHPTQNPSFSAPDTAPVVPVNRAAIPRYRSLAAALLRLASLPPTPRRRLLSLPPFTPSLSSRVPAYQSVGEEEGTRPGRSVGRSVGGLSDLAAASPFLRWDLARFAPWPPSRRHRPPRPPRRHRHRHRLLLRLPSPSPLPRTVSFLSFCRQRFCFHEGFAIWFGGQRFCLRCFAGAMRRRHPAYGPLPRLVLLSVLAALFD